MPAGTSGNISVFVSDDADVILDIDGYFAPQAAGGLSLYATTPCRVIDTRPKAFDGILTTNVEGSTCAPPSTAQAYVLNGTVVPSGALTYLTLWPAGEAQPYVSTLNAEDGAITSNMAIVPTSDGSIDAFSSNSTNLILDLSGYFAPSAGATATPAFSPAAGTYNSAQNITITDSAQNAEIYYTTDGTTPTTASNVYSEPISVSSTETLKAIALAPGYALSAVATAAYTITLPTATPQFLPSAGTYTSAQNVTISDTTPGAVIYYTTNGTTPTTSSTKYTGAIAVSSSETLAAIAVAPGYSQSALATAVYTIAFPASTPTLSLATGAYTGPQTLTITDTTPGAVIYYTTDRTTPSSSSKKYTGTLTVSSSETLQAIAVATGYSQSPVAAAVYTISPATPPVIVTIAGNGTSGYSGDGSLATAADAELSWRSRERRRWKYLLLLIQQTTASARLPLERSPSQQ